MSQTNFDEVEALFSRCLLRVLDLDLWSTYLKYVKIKHAGQKGEIEATQIAYDFVIKYMGHDVNAYKVVITHCYSHVGADTHDAYRYGVNTLNG
jgi:cleavage stimulation factor subunit 3